MDPLDESLARRALRKAAMTDRPVADREPLSPLRDVTTYDARRREVAEMIAEGDAQSDDGLMGPDGLADALMEIADGWYRSALDAAHPDEAGLQEAVLVVLEAVRPRPLGPGMDATPTLRYDSPAIGVLRAALAQPAVPVAGAERHHGSWSRSRGFEPGDPVAGAEPELQALAHEIAKEWTPHDHDPVKCPECAALRAAQPEDDGLARSGVDDVGEDRLTMERGGLIHALTPDDIRNTECGIWIAGETWHLGSGRIHSRAVTCEPCRAALATTQPERRDGA